MTPRLALAPSGHLSVEDEPESPSPLSEATAAALRQAFGQSSADGLLWLASSALEGELPAELVFWRGFAQDLFQRLCHLGEPSLDQWAALTEPEETEANQLVAEAPPMRGLEYLSAERLRLLWRELRELVVARARQHAEGPAAWLRAVNPLWHLLGRVTFHLAENKGDPARPFAFLATYTHRLSGQSRLQHLPLGQALRTYAGAREQARLAALLEPVRRAAAQSALVRQLLESKALFAPQAWTIREAYRFLTESSAMEQAGVVVRVPNWWSARERPRPQVQVHIGNRPTSVLGTEQLLDFQVNLALDGQPLSEEERRQLLAAGDGLVLLCGKCLGIGLDTAENPEQARGKRGRRATRAATADSSPRPRAAKKPSTGRQSAQKTPQSAQKSKLEPKRKTRARS
jgi:non-specific serine/threonine protein kinase